MDIKIYFDLIREAQQRLVDNPQDYFHDITHHYRVLENARLIIEYENLQSKINPQLIEIVCWWHDVQVKEIEILGDKRIVAATAQYLSEKMPKGLSDTTFDAIGRHEFGDNPKSLEGKILQDADKLEVLSTERTSQTPLLIRAGLLSQQRVLEIVDILENKFLPNMMEHYHFEYSRQRHLLEQKGFLQTISNLKKQLTDEFGMNFD